MDKLHQNIQQIKDDVQRKDYNLKKVNKSKKDPFRKKRVKKLLRKIRNKKEESTKDRILTFFELGKELGDDRTNGENKYDKNLARQIYKSFEKVYPWMPFNRQWKLRHFSRMSIKDVEEIVHS